MTRSIMKVSIQAFEPNYSISPGVRYEFFQGDVLIGIALISAAPEFYFLHFLSVMPNLRGQGCGSLMLQTICDLFNHKPIHLQLDASSPFGLENLKAWYGHYGFIDLGEHNMVRDASPLCRYFQPLWSR